jgi:uncharacterized protein (DUF427 family)
MSKTMQAVWKGAVLARSDRTVEVEGNHYFPPDSLVSEHFRPSTKTTVCGWKGTASYHDVVVGDEVNPASAWFYPTPKDAAAEIKDHVAFWNGVEVAPT